MLEFKQAPDASRRKSTMSSSFPPEILDLIVDHLHDDPTTLRACCLASQSWIPRTRAHLFANVEFRPISSPIELWTRVFPDPSNSPAHYVRSLSTGTGSYFTTTGMSAHPWICSFRHVVKLDISYDDGRTPLAPLHGFSPVLKALLLVYYSVPLSEIFDLICSFPSLEDLSLNSLAEVEPEGGWTIPSTSPKLTGKLVFNVVGSWIRPHVRRLLDLPGGLHFSSISITCPIGGAESVVDLVLGSSDTLVSLRIGYYPSGAFPRHRRSTSTLPLPTDVDVSTALPPLTLSKATRLEDLEFYLSTETVQWITRTLQSAKSEHLQRITISTTSFSFSDLDQATVRHGWEDLDHVLVQLWTSYSVHPRIKCAKTLEFEYVEGQVQVLLPELTSRGIIDVIGGSRW